MYNTFTVGVFFRCQFCLLKDVVFFAIINSNATFLNDHHAAILSDSFLADIEK